MESTDPKENTKNITDSILFLIRDHLMPHFEVWKKMS